jgi:hypothetical protein
MICLCNRQVLVGDHFLKSLFALCVLITIVMVKLLREFGPYGIIFMTMCVYYFRFFHHS